MNAVIRASARRRGIARLCHFTPSRNLVHIATDPTGLLASTQLEEDEKAILNATDLARLDGFPDHVCCSIQYPNAWYFRKARQDAHIFADWVVLLLNPHHLWAAGTKFCPRNAAASSGTGVAEGAQAFDSMFGASVVGAYGKTYTRSPSHPAWLPTDEQAEVLIPDRVSREDLIGVAVLDQAQARREHARLTQLLVEVPPIVVAPDFFEPYWLSSKLRVGIVPAETPFQPGATR